MLRFWLILLSIFLSFDACAQDILRIAAYGGEIPNSLIHQFEQETRIKVYLSTFESNENLLLKLKSSKQGLYDLITPSNYYVERFKSFNMLEDLNLERIPNAKGISDFFLNKNQTKVYGLPFVWGATGIFYNQKYIKQGPKKWLDFWLPMFKDKLIEVFCFYLRTKK